MVSDAYEDVKRLMEKGTSESTMPSNILKAGEADEGADPPVPLPSLAEIGDLLSTLENISNVCNFSDAAHFLRKAMTVLSRAKKKS